MVNINLYKIQDYDKVMSCINEDYELSNSKKEKINNSFFNFSLYLYKIDKINQISWNWILEAFGENPFHVKSRPRAIVLITNGESYYAITFGHSYYHINKYSNKEWVFDFAQRVDYSNIKSLEVDIPNSKLKKKINAYIDYNELDINSGENLAKLDANFNVDDNVENILHNRINVGNCLKLNIKEKNLKSIAYVINYVNDIIENEEVKKDFPQFKKIKDIKNLNNIFNDYIFNDDNEIDNFFLEFSYSYNNIPLNEYDFYSISFLDEKKLFSSLEIDEVINFIRECKSKDKDKNNIDNLEIEFGDNVKIKLKEIFLVDYDTDINSYIFMNGDWYECNVIYLNYIKESMDEIEIEDNLEYPFYQKDYFDYFKSIDYNLKCDFENFDNMDFEKLKKYLSDKEIKYFHESSLNQFLSDKKGYVLLDKKNEQYKKHTVEIADLYKDDKIFVVKIGSGAKLAYTIEQSLLGLKLIHNKETDKVNKNDLKYVYIWFILDLKNKIASLNDLNSLILKNRLDYWKKEVRLKGYIPKVKISYKYK